MTLEQRRTIPKRVEGLEETQEQAIETGRNDRAELHRRVDALVEANVDLTERCEAMASALGAMTTRNAELEDWVAQIGAAVKIKKPKKQ